MHMTWERHIRMVTDAVMCKLRGAVNTGPLPTNRHAEQPAVHPHLHDRFRRQQPPVRRAAFLHTPARSIHELAWDNARLSAVTSGSVQVRAFLKLSSESAWVAARCHSCVSLHLGWFRYRSMSSSRGGGDLATRRLPDGYVTVVVPFVTVGVK